ncbi:hypothetical protein ENBRE01_2852 [Enteropsectra breve]|nr:hypothetical protein ENBRE01_2852 [Enteropsectra breve]
MAKQTVPLEKLFEFYKKNATIEVQERNSTKTYRGTIAGFDQHINILLDTKQSRIFIKGDCIAVISCTVE